MISVRTCTLVWMLIPCRTDFSATVGKTLAYTSIRFTNSKDELVARGSHTKYVSLAWKEEKNITDELSPRP